MDTRFDLYFIKNPQHYWMFGIINLILSFLKLQLVIYLLLDLMVGNNFFIKVIIMINQRIL